MHKAVKCYLAIFRNVREIEGNIFRFLFIFFNLENSNWIKKILLNKLEFICNALFNYAMQLFKMLMCPWILKQFQPNTLKNKSNTNRNFEIL